MPPYLPPLEITFFVSSYLALVAYGCWQLFAQSDTILAVTQSTVDDVYFRRGWLPPLTGRPQEIDYEWTVWTRIFLKHLPWFGVHALLSAGAGRLPAAILRTANIASGLLFVAINYGPRFAGAIAGAAALALWLVQRRRRNVLWLLFGGSFLALNSMRTLPWIGQLVQPLSDDWMWELHVVLAWLLMRMLSACLDLIDAAERAAAGAGPQSRRPSGWDALAYMLYVPTFFYGPIVIFGRYTDMLAERQHSRTHSGALFSLRLPAFAGRVARMAAQVAAVELLGHLFYLGALQSAPELCERLPLSALYAFGFLMGCVFFLKYRVAYGWSLALAQLDGMRTPPLPRFIGRVHLYSDMWKWFDHGLYEFLFRYVYGRVVRHGGASLRRRLAGAAVTFGFIYVFHGAYDYVLVWCVLNYVCIAAELAARALLRAHRQRLDGWLRPEWQRRWLALAGAQLLIPAVLSNFFFFAGYEVGAVFVRRTYWESGWWEYAQLSGLAVCFWHTGAWLKWSAAAAPV